MSEITVKDLREVTNGTTQGASDSSAVLENDPQSMWMNTKKELLLSIDIIDKATRWSETEPKWWLEMMDIRKAVSNVI